MNPTLWIRICDKKPPKDGRYLIYEPRTDWVGVSSYRRNKFDDVLTTHWMELPSKPEKEKADE